MKFRRLSIVVLISGRGTNLRSIIDAVEAGLVPARVCGVISNVPDAAGLDHAAASGIPTSCVDHRSFANREAFGIGLREQIDGYHPDLVVLAGFMRILPSAFVNHYDGRLVNIHPSLLPLFPGLDTHQRALDAGVDEHGASVHFVTLELDGGPVIVQAKVPVLSGDTADTLAARVLVQEHRLYPLAIRWIATGRLTLADGQPVLDASTLVEPRVLGMDCTWPEEIT